MPRLGHLPVRVAAHLPCATVRPGAASRVSRLGRSRLPSPAARTPRTPAREG